MPARVIVAPDAAALDRAALAVVLDAAREAIAARGRFDLALSGGRTPRGLYDALAAAVRAGGLDARATHVWFTDERAAPPGDPARNDRMVRERLLDPARIPEDHVHPMPVAAEDLDAAALGYERELPARLDLAVLGVGEDGHVASLFPRAPLLEPGAGRVGVVRHSPKPPPVRMTLLPPALASARALLVLASGEGKAAAIARVRGGSTPAETPATLAWEHPAAVWVIDAAAAGERA